VKRCCFPLRSTRYSSSCDGDEQGPGDLGRPKSQRLTTREAADFLGISRPTLVKLLEGGEIPFEQPSRHRRVLLSDVVAFKQRGGMPAERPLPR